MCFSPSDLTRQHNLSIGPPNADARKPILLDSFRKGMTSPAQKGKEPMSDHYKRSLA